MKKYLVTSALPYANGPLHFGHMAGAYLPADVYTRHRRLQGEKVMFISGSDEHGVAITLKAKQLEQSYQEYVNDWHQKHAELFKKYDIEFDFFGQTSADYHAEEAVKWFKDLHEKGAIQPKDEQQLKCFDCKNLLPDRYVEGTCYSCGYEHARGDECPNCGEWIDPIKLKDPVCKICGSKNIKETTVTQYYLMLTQFEEKFKEWFGTKKHWRKTVVPFVEGLAKDGLVDRAITRDLDWGIDIPVAGEEGKKMYVWFDAPIGYVSNTKEYLKRSGSSEDYIKDWWKNDDTDIIHFIGKDNIIFHSMIFPIMAMGTGFINPPADVPANQYVNLEGKQFSKSSGWYVDSEKALEDFGPDALRYYLISIIPENNDSSFTWDQFASKVNGELANNVGNFINRGLKFFNKNWPEGIDRTKYASFSQTEIARKLTTEIEKLNNFLDDVQIKRAIEQVMHISALANTYFNDMAPWAVFKEDKDKAAEIIAHSVQLVLVLGTVLSPFLPTLSKRIREHFGDFYSDELMQKIYKGDLESLDMVIPEGMTLAKAPEALIKKIDPKVIEALNEELKQL